MFGFSGMRPATAGQRRLLYVAAAFNFVAGVLVVLLARAAPQWLGVDPFSGSQLFYVDLFAWLVLAFGLAYALGGYDLPRFWPCIAMGVFGKVGVAALALAYFLADRTGPLVMMLASGDAIFAVVFARILSAQCNP